MFCVCRQFFYFQCWLTNFNHDGKFAKICIDYFLYCRYCFAFYILRHVTYYFKHRRCCNADDDDDDVVCEMLADKQTDRHAHHNTPLPCTAWVRVGVIIRSRQFDDRDMIAVSPFVSFDIRRGLYRISIAGVFVKRLHGTGTCLLLIIVLTLARERIKVVK